MLNKALIGNCKQFDSLNNIHPKKEKNLYNSFVGKEELKPFDFEF